MLGENKAGGKPKECCAGIKVNGGIVAKRVVQAALAWITLTRIALADAQGKGERFRSMRMSTSLRLMSFLVLSIAAAFSISAFGFGIAHSEALGLVAFLLSPGIVVIFVSERLGSTGSWAALILVNVIYYEAVYRAAGRMRREKR